jgi:hypothetical protein
MPYIVLLTITHAPFVALILGNARSHVTISLSMTLRFTSRRVPGEETVVRFGDAGAVSRVPQPAPPRRN